MNGIELILSQSEIETLTMVLLLSIILGGILYAVVLSFLFTVEYWVGYLFLNKEERTLFREFHHNISREKYAFRLAMKGLKITRIGRKHHGE